jgi:hypothetical protein
MTLAELIDAYKTDPESTYHGLRYRVRQSQEGLLKRIVDRHGAEPLNNVKTRVIKAWHREWSHNGEKIAMGHSVMAQLRTLFSFGMTMLEDADCERLVPVMSAQRFPAPAARTECLTADQVINVRAEAHKRGWHSIALAQALQFELILRQKDVIGEWVPLDEPGTSDVTWHGHKWLHGLRGSEIDRDLTLRHVTSKRGKLLEISLSLAPMVLEELAFVGDRLTSGPLVICEHTKRPWSANEYRRKWRICADAVGVPKSVKNMDSRAGGITEATGAGADIEHVRHAATHSSIQMTQRYSRGAAEKIENVQKLRLESRKRADRGAA